METVRVNFEGNCYRGAVVRCFGCYLSGDEVYIVRCDDGKERAFLKQHINFDYSRVEITYTEGWRFYGAYLYEPFMHNYSKKLRSLNELNEWLATRNVQLQAERMYDEDRLFEICGQLLWKHGMTAAYNHNFDPS